MPPDTVVDPAADAAAAAAAAAATAAAAAAAAKPWFDGEEAELVGHLQNKGWDKLDPAKAAIEAAKAHREAQGYIGVPADRLIRLPTDAADEAGWKGVWAKLGAPPDATGYDFSEVKNADGTPANPALVEAIRSAAAGSHLPKSAAAAIAKAVVAFDASSGAETTAAAEAALAVEQLDLAKNWGANAPVNKVIATRAAVALGVDEDTVALLEKQIGYSKVMNMFLAVGQKIGEANFIPRGDGNYTPGVMTVEQAKARVQELQADKDWVVSYFEGDAAKKREFSALNTIIANSL